MQTIKILTPNGLVTVEIKDGQDLAQLEKELIEKYGTFIQL